MFIYVEGLFFSAALLSSENQILFTPTSGDKDNNNIEGEEAYM